VLSCLLFCALLSATPARATDNPQPNPLPPVLPRKQLADPVRDDVRAIMDGIERGKAARKYYRALRIGQGGDMAQAVALLRESARDGYEPAQVTLASMYMDAAASAGLHDDKKALQLLDRARAKAPDDPAALYYLGLIHREGRAGLPRDPTTALSLITRAADGGFGPALHMLGYMYLKGDGVPKNKDKAVKWLRRAAMAGVPESQYNLGYLYARNGDRHDAARAVKWLSRAAAQGFAPAQFRLALLYRDGKGVPADAKKAAALMQAAARQNFAPAQWELASLYLDGKGVPKSVKKEYFWQSLAIANGLNDVVRRLITFISRARLDAATVKTLDAQVKQWQAVHPAYPQ